MERGKFEQLVEEFPALETIQNLLWAEVHGKNVHRGTPKATVSRIDKNLLLRMPLALHGAITAGGDDWVVESLWAVHDDNSVTRLKLFKRPMIESLAGHIGASYFVLAEGVYQGHLTEGFYSLEMTVLKPPKRFDLEEYVSVYFASKSVSDELEDMAAMLRMPS